MVPISSFVTGEIICRFPFLQHMFLLDIKSSCLKPQVISKLLLLCYISCELFSILVPLKMGLSFLCPLVLLEISPLIFAQELKPTDFQSQML